MHNVDDVDEDIFHDESDDDYDITELFLEALCWRLLWFPTIDLFLEDEKIKSKNKKDDINYPAQFPEEKISEKKILGPRLSPDFAEDGFRFPPASLQKRRVGQCPVCSWLRPVVRTL